VRATALNSVVGVDVRYARVVPIWPGRRDDPEALVRRGEQLGRRGDRAGAEAAYRRADAAGSAEGAANHGMLLYERGAVAASRAALQRADERGSAMGTFRLGFLLEEQGEEAEAEALYRRAVERGNTHAMNNLAVMLQRRGDWPGAREVYQRMAQASDPRPAAQGRDMVRRIDAAGGRRPRPVPPPGFDPDASLVDSMLWIAGDPTDRRVQRAREITFAHALRTVAADPSTAQQVATLWRELGEPERAEAILRAAEGR
jgi:tetratricopeptide (TPR) repeat protein